MNVYSGDIRAAPTICLKSGSCCKRAAAFNIQRAAFSYPCGYVSSVCTRSIGVYNAAAFYVENAVLEDCRLNTKDAFWHSSGVTVKNSVINGEYLAWYSKDLTLINCKISGTQPFCYCQGLTLIDCEMADCDLAFERSDVNAVITTPVTSIKNPYSGTISVPSAGELIIDDPAAEARINITGGK